MSRDFIKLWKEEESEVAKEISGVVIVIMKEISRIVILAVAVGIVDMIMEKRIVNKI